MAGELALADPFPSGDEVMFDSDRDYRDACCNDLFAMNADGSGQHWIRSDTFGSGDWGLAPLQAGGTTPGPKASARHQADRPGPRPDSARAPAPLADMLPPGGGTRRSRW